MNKIKYKFGKKDMFLAGGSDPNGGISRSSQMLSRIIGKLENKVVLDQGCGVGFMSIGALLMGAKKVIATDITDEEAIIRKNIELNGLDQGRLEFKMSDLFESLPNNEKFEVIIANLPQHALPASMAAKKLKGKYGGFDGTDLVCRSLSEAVHYLREDGRYFGAISELTNFNRTVSIASLLYQIRVCLTQEKVLRVKEMNPFITDITLRNHLQKLYHQGLIRYSEELDKSQSIKYNVLFCEFIKK